MTTEALGALRMRRDTLERDLNALLRGEAGSSISAAQVSFYKTQLAVVNGMLANPAKPALKLRA
ncbi:MAG TPA: hypothetical protein PLH23_03840 [Hyphomonadaceae bacterium]|nr:hypothetical protein [Hyphomonadaceae bacterium]